MFKNIFKKNKNYNNKYYKWFLLILNDIILAISIFFFIIGPRLNNGGLDGFSSLTTQIIEYIEPSIKGNFNSYFVILHLFYNLITIFLAYKFFGKKFCQKTVFLALFLSGIFFLLDICIKENDVERILSMLQLNFNENHPKIKRIFSYIISGTLGGFLIGYTLSNIRNLGYNTGGLEIYQKILKDIYGINFVLTLLLTDGVIVLCSSFLHAQIGFFLIKLFCSLLSIIIVGFVMEKRDNLIIKKKNK